MAKLVVDQVDLAGKRVFLRADFNVPLDGARVTDDTRITAVLPTLSSCLDRGASVVLASHLGRPKGKADPKYSLRPVAEQAEEQFEGLSEAPAAQAAQFVRGRAVAVRFASQTMDRRRTATSPLRR